MLWMLCGILLLIIIMLMGKIVLMRKSAQELSEGLPKRNNTFIGISSRDRKMRELAECINIQLNSLREERQHYQQGNLELQEAVTNISHDLRTPLAVISGYLELMEREPMSDNALRHLQVIQKRTQSMTQLAEDLFQYSVLTSKTLNTTAAVNISALLQESIVEFLTEFSKKGIALAVSMPDTAVHWKVEYEAMHRVFTNLLSNALKYSEGNIEITLTKEDISFSNVSASIDPVSLERLFDRFYTVQTGRNSTGLGLTISRTLVERMNGTMTAHYQNGLLTIRIHFHEDSQYQ